MTKLETLKIHPGDDKQAVKQLTGKIIHGVGAPEDIKRFVTNEAQKEKPPSLEAYFDFASS